LNCLVWRLRPLVRGSEIGNMEEIEAGKLLDIFFNPTKANQKWDAINKVEEHISSLPDKVWGDLVEDATPGLYIRQITLPKGTLLTSRIHKTCHPFVVTKGAITVYNTIGDTQELYHAGHKGITYPGTRRVLYTHEETTWTTYHPTNRITNDFFNLESEEKQVIFDSIMSDIIQEYYNPLLINFDEGIFI